MDANYVDMDTNPARRWTITWSATAARGMNRLPARVVDAVAAFVEGPLAEAPHRVTKPLHAPFEGKRSAYRGSYRILVEIDEPAHTVRIYDVVHRADAYRPR